MNLKEAKDCVNLIFDANDKTASSFNSVPLLRGHTGIGKTEIFNQIASERGMGLIVCHLSQMSDVGDLMGLIEIVDDEITGEKMTKFLPPNFLPRSGKHIFLLDELNHARQDVRKAVFEFMLNGKLGSYRMPEGCLVACAENPDTIDYQVSSFENAASSARMCILKVDADVNVWADYAYKNESKFNPALTSFILDNPEFLKYSKFESFENDDVTLTFRSLEMISQIEKLKPNDTVLFNVLTGFGGNLFANKYINSRKDKQYNVNIVEVLANYTRVKPTIEKMVKNGASAMQGKICNDLYEHLLKNKDLNKKESGNALKMLLAIDKEISFNFSKKCINSIDIIFKDTNFLEIVFNSSKLREHYMYEGLELKQGGNDEK